MLINTMYPGMKYEYRPMGENMANVGWMSIESNSVPHGPPGIRLELMASNGKGRFSRVVR